MSSCASTTSRFSADQSTADAGSRTTGRCQPPVIGVTVSELVRSRTSRRMPSLRFRAAAWPNQFGSRSGRARRTMPRSRSPPTRRDTRAAPVPAAQTIQSSVAHGTPCLGVSADLSARTTGRTAAASGSKVLTAPVGVSALNARAWPTPTASAPVSAGRTGRSHLTPPSVAIGSPSNATNAAVHSRCLVPAVPFRSAQESRAAPRSRIVALRRNPKALIDSSIVRGSISDLPSEPARSAP